jgi:hypothetical protein
MRTLFFALTFDRMFSIKPHEAEKFHVLLRSQIVRSNPKRRISMAFTFDTTLGEILDDPQAKTVMDQYVPGVSANPMMAMVKGVSLNMLLAMPQAAQFGITREKVEMMLAEINKRHS